MYRYDEFDRTLVAERVAEFRDQVARRLSGALTEDEFKPLRLMNGVYLQLLVEIVVAGHRLLSRQGDGRPVQTDGFAQVARLQGAAWVLPDRRDIGADRDKPFRIRGIQQICRRWRR